MYESVRKRNEVDNTDNRKDNKKKVSLVKVEQVIPFFCVYKAV